MFSIGSPALSLPPRTAKAMCKCVPLTPERIPSFIIPSLKPISSPRAHRKQHQDPDRTRLLSPDRCASPRRHELLSPSFALSRRSPVKVSKLSPVCAGRATRATGRILEDQFDPSTSGALRLDHVKKISTPYGFRTLAESPHVRRRESLFHGEHVGAGDHQPPASSDVGVGMSLSKRRGNTLRPPSDSEQVSSLPEEHQENSAKSPNGVLKAAKDGLQMVLKKTRIALQTATPQRAKKPSSTCS